MQVIEEVQASGAQVLISGTECPRALDPGIAGVRMFHVEQGQIGA